MKDPLQSHSIQKPAMLRHRHGYEWDRKQGVPLAATWWVCWPFPVTWPAQDASSFSHRRSKEPVQLLWTPNRFHCCGLIPRNLPVCLKAPSFRQELTESFPVAFLMSCPLPELKPTLKTSPGLCDCMKVRCQQRLLKLTLLLCIHLGVTPPPIEEENKTGS